MWDLGWCLGQLLIGMVASSPSSSSGTTAMTTTTTTTHQGKSTNRRIQVPARVSEALHAAERGGGGYHRRLVDGGALVLELGCGVGLTGLVAAAALQARAVVLTDLPVVIDKVTQPNVVRNTTEKKIQKNNSSSGGGGGSSVVRVIHNGNNNQVLAMPLCWGNAKDEQAVAAVLESLATAKQQPTCTKGRPRKKKGASTAPTIESSSISSSSRKPGIPDLVVIGDVAYQHAPGAPSHFDALVSTLLQFVDERTLVLFGTRIRMPASVDLLALLLEHLEPVVEPAVTVDEIEPAAFANVKHNMSIHFLRKKKGAAANVATNTNTADEIDD